MCQAEEICKHLSGELDLGKNMKFEVDTGYHYYINNWQQSLNLMCTPKSKIAAVSSFYFVGFIFGLALFPLPNLLGRKKSMSLIMLVYIMASALTLYGNSLFLKTVGMFI